MIIKYYNLSFPGELRIMDNASSVTVIQNLYTGLCNGPDIDAIDLHLLYDADSIAKGKNAQFIDFTQDNIRCRLSVYGKAYVCNDNGKTIEVVDPMNGFQHESTPSHVDERKS